MKNLEKLSDSVLRIISRNSVFVEEGETTLIEEDSLLLPYSQFNKIYAELGVLFNSLKAPDPQMCEELPREGSPEPQQQCLCRSKNSTETKSHFEEAAEPLIKYLNENHHPHTYVEVTQVSAEVVEGVKKFFTYKHIKG